MSSSSRSSKQSRLNALQRLKAARNKTESALDQIESDDEGEELFAEMSDEEYQQLVQQRREKEFVVDDNGLGYADDGEEWIDKVQPEQQPEDQKDDPSSTKSMLRKAKKKFRNSAGGNQKVQGGQLLNFFNKSSRVSSTKSATKKKKTGSAKGLDLDSLLDELGSSSPKKSSLGVKKRKVGSSLQAKHPATKRRSAVLIKEEVEIGSGGDDAEDFGQDVEFEVNSAPQQDTSVTDMETDGVLPEKQENTEATTKKLQEKEKENLAEKANEGHKQENASAPRRSRFARQSSTLQASTAVAEALQSQESKPLSQEKSMPSKPTANMPYVAPKIDMGNQGLMTGTMDLSQGSNGSQLNQTSVDQVLRSVEGEAGLQYVDMYWIHAEEISGTVYLFGKVQVEGNYLSCCVSVHNFERTLLVLPRVKKDGTRAEMTEVWPEISSLLTPMIPGENKFRAKMVKRKYAFDLQDIPREEEQYLKVKYLAKYPPPPAEAVAKGKNYSHIFGARTPVVESFLMKRKMMGPQWLRIKGARVAGAAMSWCKFEFTVSDPKAVQVIKDNHPPVPPIKTISISLKTVVNPTTHTHEVIAISGLVHTCVQLEGYTQQDKSLMKQFTAIRPLGSTGLGSKNFPPDFQRKSQKFGVMCVPNERALLNLFFQKLQIEDPDAVVAHNLYGFDLDILFGRAVHNKLSTWSKLGRLRRTQTPRTKGNGSFSLNLCAGRLMVDTYASARELLRETTYSLSSLATTQLNLQRQELDPMDIPNYFDTSDNVLQICRHTAFDSELVQRLLLKLQILPLTKQLTNISGNLWSRTCKGNRAERIEYLLMHEFHNLKFIVPEPVDYVARKAKKKGDNGPSYEGGLVLEPKKGLYDTFILLLDFNSLYPSIIQEFNLCFTTINWTEFLEKEQPKEDNEGKSVAKLPPVPSDSLAQGVLPRVIKTLVSRRATVKKLLKEERDPAKKQEFDIRQKALKLTANSMYGCLGFSHSRFYAKPIAALVTAQGRETLQRTVDLAQNQLSLEVIYGDTDSIMVNTHSTDLQRVKEIGNQIKKESNKLYKTLELEMDGVFKSMLLLKKKKYAALVVVERDGQLTYEKELKGLDLVRRDWCVMSKETGRYVVDQILSGDNREDIVERIHSRIEELAEEMRSGKMPLQKYVITKGMNKAIKDYPDSNTQPHLQVALAMEKAGKPVSVGDHIPYIICKQLNLDGSEVPTSSGGKGIAERARHPDELTRSQGLLVPDIDWYLSQQIVPPISRLCEPIEGTSALMIAQRLGLDTSKFNRGPATHTDELEEMWSCALTSKLDDTERFKDCSRLRLVCKVCKEEQDFPGVVLRTTKGCFSGLRCPKESCGAEFWGHSTLSNLCAYMWNTTVLLLRECQNKYYLSWLVCEDSTCNRRTQQLSVAGTGCMHLGCKGTMIPEYDESMLHNQLKYFQCLFDVKRAEENNPKDKEFPILSKDQKDVFKVLLEVSKKDVESSAYNWIRPSLWTTVFGSKK